MKVQQLKPKAGDPSKAWARPRPLSGPRLPLERPPELALKFPRPGAKKVDTSTLLEIGEHPWAGQRVELWLEATDVAGQIGRSKPIEIVLPSRRFKKPLARALVEQRRKLSGRFAQPADGRQGARRSDDGAGRIHQRHFGLSRSTCDLPSPRPARKRAPPSTSSSMSFGSSRCRSRMARCPRPSGR